MSEGRWRGVGTDEALPIYAGLVRSALGLAVGCFIGWVDTRPNWDDTGVTVGMLFLAAGGTAALGARWWLAVLLITGPVILLEYRTAGFGIIIIPAIGALGALLGQTLSHALRRHRTGKA
jgi:hypothetical protein